MDEHAWRCPEWLPDADVLLLAACGRRVRDALRAVCGSATGRPVRLSTARGTAGLWGHLPLADAAAVLRDLRGVERARLPGGGRCSVEARAEEVPQLLAAARGAAAQAAAAADAQLAAGRRRRAALCLATFAFPEGVVSRLPQERASDLPRAGLSSYVSVDGLDVVTDRDHRYPLGVCLSLARAHELGREGGSTVLQVVSDVDLPWGLPGPPVDIHAWSLQFAGVALRTNSVRMRSTRSLVALDCESEMAVAIESGGTLKFLLLVANHSDNDGVVDEDMASLSDTSDSLEIE